MEMVVLIGESSSRVLRGLLLKTAASGVMSGSKTEGTHASAPTVVGVQKTETGLGPPSQIVLLPQKVYQLIVKRDLRSLPWAMHMHMCLVWQIPAPSWAEGHEP